jgi:hypothetical protein
VDPLHSVSTSNTNANFNSHFTRPYVRTPSSPQFYGPAASNLFSTAEPACGYDSCRQTNPNSLNVHVVCHTHLDTGWVETYDEYYHHCEFMFSVTRLWSHCPLNLHLMILFLWEIFERSLFISVWLNEWPTLHCIANSITNTH